MNDIHDLLGAYCTDALDADERAAFEQHLATCAECRDEAADFREVLAALADAHPVRPPRALEDAVVAGARAGGGPARPRTLPTTGPSDSTTRRDGDGAPGSDRLPAGPGVAPRRPVDGCRRRGSHALRRRGGPRAQPGPGGVGRRRTSDMAAVVAVASAADAHVLPVDIMGTTSRVVMSGEMDKAVFLASELPMPAKGMVYQVWSVAEDGPMDLRRVVHPGRRRAHRGRPRRRSGRASTSS